MLWLPRGGAAVASVWEGLLLGLSRGCRPIPVPPSESMLTMQLLPCTAPHPTRPTRPPAHLQVALIGDAMEAHGFITEQQLRDIVEAEALNSKSEVMQVRAADARGWVGGWAGRLGLIFSACLLELVLSACLPLLSGLACSKGPAFEQPACALPLLRSSGATTT